MSLTILIYSLFALIIINSCMILYLYKFLLNLTENRYLINNEAGLKKGIAYPLDSLKTLDGKNITKPNDKDGIILIITSSGCDSCKRVYPFLEELRRENNNIQFNILMEASKQQAETIINKYNLKNIPVSVIHNEQFHKLGIESFPFSYLLAPSGHIIEKGLVNHKKDFSLLISFLKHKKTA